MTSLNELAPIGIALRGDEIGAALDAEERARADSVAEIVPAHGDSVDPDAFDLGEREILAAPEPGCTRRPPALGQRLVPVGAGE